MFKVGTVEVRPGEKAKGFLRVGSDTDGTPFNIPLLVVGGKKPGPTVWLEGCVHGEEFGGAASIISLFHELDPSDLSGNLVCMPVVNLPGYKARSRISPIDGVNLNRAFPGSATGSYSQRLAKAVLDAIKEVADVVIDLHSGGIGCIVPYYAIYKDDGSETAAISSWLAERANVDLIWRVSGGETAGVTISAQTVHNGIPSVTIENAGGAALTEEQEEQYKDSIRSMLRALKMLAGEPALKKQYTVVSGGDFVYTSEGGMFIPACSAGEVRNKGELVGQVMNLYGEIVEEVRSGVDNGFILAVGSRYYPMEPGQLVCEILPFEGKRGPSELKQPLKFRRFNS